MIFQRRMIFCLVTILIVVLISNFYFIQMIVINPKLNEKYRLSTTESSKKLKIPSASSELYSKIKSVRLVEEEIIQEIQRLPSEYFKRSPKSIQLFEMLFEELKVIDKINENNIPHILKKVSKSFIFITLKSQNFRPFVQPSVHSQCTLCVWINNITMVIDMDIDDYGYGYAWIWIYVDMDIRGCGYG